MQINPYADYFRCHVENRRYIRFQSALCASKDLRRCGVGVSKSGAFAVVKTIISVFDKKEDFLMMLFVFLNGNDENSRGGSWSAQCPRPHDATH